MAGLALLDGFLPIGFLVCGYFSYRCQTRPTPLAEDGKATDTLSRFGIMRFWSFYSLYVFFFATLHALLAALYLSHHQPTICSAGCSVNETLFNWNWHTATLMLLIILSGKLRMEAYSQLGSEFTYNLSTPNRLITTGLYGYVRHPSYSAHAVNNLAMTMLFMRRDGAFGCFFPDTLTRIPHLATIHFTLNLILVPACASIRVPEEEKLLRETFKGTWEAYAAQTSRFIPWIF